MSERSATVAEKIFNSVVARSARKRIAWQLRTIADRLDEGSLWMLLRSELNAAIAETECEKEARLRVEAKLQRAEQRLLELERSRGAR